VTQAPPSVGQVEKKKKKKVSGSKGKEKKKKRDGRLLAHPSEKEKTMGEWAEIALEKKSLKKKREPGYAPS